MVQTEPLKFWTVFLPEKKRRAFFPFSFFFFLFFFFISCSLAKFITRKVCCVVLPIKCWHGGSVARVFWGQNVSCKKRWVHETASSTRIINGSCKHCIKEKKISYDKWKKTKQNKTKTFLILQSLFLDLKKSILGFCWLLKSRSLKKIGNTPSSHIFHSLRGEYCWMVRDS